MNLGAPIAAAFWLALLLLGIYGLTCDLRRLWKHRHDPQQLAAFLTVDETAEVSSTDREIA